MTLQQAKDQVAKIHYFNSWAEIDWYQMDAINERTEPPYMEEKLQEEVFQLYGDSQYNRGIEDVLKIVLRQSWIYSTPLVESRNSLIEELKKLKR